MGGMNEIRCGQPSLSTFDRSDKKQHLRFGEDNDSLIGIWQITSGKESKFIET
jgi:hypothetical protein